jgi:hypothetical protein
MQHIRVAVVRSTDVDIETALNRRLEQLEGHDPPVTILTVTIQIAHPQSGDRTVGLITYRYDDPRADSARR